jgi:hypothetical protein
VEREERMREKRMFSTSSNSNAGSTSVEIPFLTTYADPLVLDLSIPTLLCKEKMWRIVLTMKV